jgi:hypothetical protein
MYEFYSSPPITGFLLAGYIGTTLYTHFSRFLDFFNMRQFNKIVNSIGRLLDLVVCNKSCRVAKADDVLVRKTTTTRHWR